VSTVQADQEKSVRSATLYKAIGVLVPLLFAALAVAYAIWAPGIRTGHVPEALQLWSRLILALAAVVVCVIALFGVAVVLLLGRRTNGLSGTSDVGARR
jgi:hypothetical protein